MSCHKKFIVNFSDLNGFPAEMHLRSFIIISVSLSDASVLDVIFFSSSQQTDALLARSRLLTAVFVTLAFMYQESLIT